LGNERRRDYMVNQRVHALYMITWITSLLLVAAAGGTGYSLYKLAPQAHVEPILGVNPFALVGVLVFVIVASGLTLGVYVIVHTHRMLGSAYHIGMHLNKFTAGEKVGPITLRDGDYFKEIADEINKIEARLKVSEGGGGAAAAPAAAPSNPPAAPPPA
jgi:hypothetical protein